MAPRYSEETIQQVMEANDIVDVVSEYVTLKKTGSSHKGKCPFHNEKTASFNVSADKQLYHCFGCGVGGNVIGFIMAIEKLPFVDALKFLARRAHIVLPESGNSAEDNARYRHRERLYELHRDLANYYYLCLKRNPGAQHYLASRGIKAETVKAFGLGLAPDGWNNALGFLSQKGYTEKEMLDSGLIMVSERGRKYDRFRNRIMFPIQNATGRLIGFGGRRISEEDKGPKYLNSPETPVFSKGTELFNMNHAKGSIVGNQLLIVEGYMDVISLYQYGIKNAVAALGTAFTQYHAALLSRYVGEVVLCFDGDAAGESATQKAIEVLKTSPLNVKILRLPVEDDPDSYIQKNGSEAFLERVKQAITVVEYEMSLLKKRFDLNNTDDRIKYINQAIGVLRQVGDNVQVDLYSKRLARETGISLRVIQQEVYRKRPRELGAEDVAEALSFGDNIAKAYEEAQIAVLQQCVANPAFLKEAELTEVYFSPGFFRELFAAIQEMTAEGRALTPATLINQMALDEKEMTGAATAVLMGERAENPEMLQESLKILRYFYDNHRMEELKRKISAATDVTEAARLMDELVLLKKELKVN
ncbi:MAG: DNA primase [Eubacterium sp.]|nr:DNA primase [Eubacterium sp.]